MLYIDYIGNNTIRFSNKSGGGGVDKYLPNNMQSWADEIDRIWIQDMDSELMILNCYKYSEITFNGNIYTDPETLVKEFNSVNISTTTTTTISELLEKAVAWYEFEETSGTTLVDETGNHNGTIQAGVTINQDNGVMGKSHTMANVANSYSVIPDDDALTLGESWTIGMVIKPTTLDNEKVYVRKDNEYRIGITNEGRLMCYQYSSGGTTIRIQKFTDTNVIVTGNTYWVIVTFTGSTFEVEVNGESKALSDLSAGTYVGMVNTTTSLRVGNAVSSGTIIGDIGQLALFVPALTTQGRSDYYSLGSGINYSSL